MIQPIRADGAAQPIGPYSPAILAGTFLFISGQVAMLDNGDIDQSSLDNEAKRVMFNLERLLAAAGLTFEHVVKSTIFLMDMADFTAVNEIYAAAFGGEGPYPARETVQVAGLPRGARVEISMIALAK